MPSYIFLPFFFFFSSFFFFFTGINIYLNWGKWKGVGASVCCVPLKQRHVFMHINRSGSMLLFLLALGKGGGGTLRVCLLVLKVDFTIQFLTCKKLPFLKEVGETESLSACFKSRFLYTVSDLQKPAFFFLFFLMGLLVLKVDFSYTF